MANGIISVDTYIDTLDGRMVWSSKANTAANTSTVSFSLQAKRPAGYSTTGTWYGHVSLYTSNNDFVGEKEVNNNVTVGTSWTTVASGSFTVSHNSSGKRSCFFVARVWAPETSSISDGGLFMAGETFALDTITRTATVTSATNFNETQNPTMTFSNPMGNAVSALQVCIADTTGKIIYVPYRDVGSKTATSYTFNLTTTERQTLINAVTSGTSIGVKFYVKMTIDGNDHRHWLQKTFSLTSALPTLSPAVVDMNDTTIALTGNENTLIKYYSTAACSSGAVTKHGATIKSQKVVNGSQTKTNTNGVFAIYNTDNKSFTFSVTDSRNNTASQTINATNFIEYVKVSCSQSVKMELSGETDAIVTLSISGNYFNKSFGAVANALTLQVRHSDNDGNMSDWVTLTDGLIPTFSGNTYKLTTTISGFQYNKEYKFQCRAVDKLSSATTGEYTAKLNPLFDWGESDFNFNVPVSFQGDIMEDFVIETGTEAMGSNGTWYWRKWKSGRAECFGCRNYGTMAITTAWGSLYRSAKFKQDLPSGLFNQLPHVINMSLRTASGWISRGGGEGTEPTATSTGEFFVCRADAQTSNSVYISFNIVGRWKN